MVFARKVKAKQKVAMEFAVNRCGSAA